MNKIKDALSRFMVGRYGMDQLYYALLVIYLIFFVLNIIFPKAMIFGLLTWAVLIYAFFRSFSRNTYKRSMENEAFLRVWDKIKNFFSLNFARIRDLPSKKYAKCPHCHAMLRLPRQKGKHTVRCPQCNNRFELKITFGSKGNKKTA